MMTFLHFNQLQRFAVNISQSCIFAADAVFLVCFSGSLWQTVLMEFPYTRWQCGRPHHTETILALFAFCLISHSAKKQPFFVVLLGLAFLCSCSLMNKVPVVRVYL